MCNLFFSLFWSILSQRSLEPAVRYIHSFYKCSESCHNGNARHRHHHRIS
jgi:hypothetical protein